MRMTITDEKIEALKQSPWSSMWCVALLDAKAWVRIPGQSPKMKYEKYFFGDSGKNSASK